MAGLHDRMPVILDAEDFDLWLDRGVKDARMFEGLFEPFPSEGMEAFPVSSVVGNPRNNSPQLIEQISFEGIKTGDA
jgi:putative SOS response-associated peptidase YedK